MPGLRHSPGVHRRPVRIDNMSITEREEFIKPFLPPVESTGQSTVPPQRKPVAAAGASRRHKPIRTFLKNQLYFLVFTLVHAFFSVYIRFRVAYHAVINRIYSILYYHHRAPEYIQKDLKGLSKLPKHLSVSLELAEDDPNGVGGLEGLVNDVSEIAAWCACAGIPVLSVYESTGILKNYIPQTHRSITRTLGTYFPPSHPNKPTVSLRAPHLPSYSPPSTPPPSSSSAPPPSRPHLTILLLSADDGRNTLVDLTKTLAEMAQRGKLSPDDIRADLIDAEIAESVMAEPDLLVCFGPRVQLRGYPPWQIRLTEIFCVPDHQGGVNYQVFVRALHRYAKAVMRFGR